MKLKLFKPNDMKQMPWKNGGGQTAEVAISPALSAVANLNFDWRVSIATISQSGPFSSFPNYDRSLVVWRGAGLLVNGVERKLFEPFHFKGEDAINAELLKIEGEPAQEVKDFGVLYERGAFKSSVTHQALKIDQDLDLESKGETFWLSARGEIRIDQFYLNSGDVLWASGDGALRAKALDRSDLITLRLEPLGANS